jgi:hypothetical protein
VCGWFEAKEEPLIVEAGPNKLLLVISFPNSLALRVILVRPKPEGPIP